MYHIASIDEHYFTNGNFLHDMKTYKVNSWREKGNEQFFWFDNGPS